MIHAQNTKSLPIVVPQSIVTSGTVTARIDTIGWEYLEVDVLLDSVAATSSVAQVIKLGENSTTVTSNFTNILEVTGGTATSTSVGFVIGSGNTSSGQVARMFVNLSAKKRYILLTLSGNADVAQLGSATAILSRGDVSPNTNAEFGGTAGVGIAN